MSKLSNEEFQAYLKQIHELAEGPLGEVQKEVEVTNKFPQEFYDLAIKNDLYRCSLPEEYGEYELNELEILQVQEEFSKGPGGMRMYLYYAMDLNWRILEDYGSEEVKVGYMPKFQNKEVFTCFALTGTTGGTDADSHTMIVEDGDLHVLNDEKTLISHADYCEFAYVIAVTNPESDKNDRLSALLVLLDTPGLETINMPHMMGCRGVGHDELKLTDCRTDKKYLLGKERQGLEIAMHSLFVSRAHIATSNLGMAQGTLELSLQCAADRVTFGKLIETHQAIRCKITDMFMMVHVPRCMAYDFVRSYMENPTGEYIEEKTAIRKLYSIDMTRGVSDEMLEIFGGVGYFGDYKYGPVERLYRDCCVTWLEEGAPIVQRITISRNTIEHGAHIEYVV